MKKYITLTISIFFATFFFTSNVSNAETLYVTDRILLGLHQQPNENSPIIESISSGTPVTVIQRQDTFIKVKLESGKEGWLLTNYLKEEKPATIAIDVVSAKLKETEESSKKLAEQLAKKDREIQIRRDELSNAKTTIKNLKQSLIDAGSDQPPPPAADTSGFEQQIRDLEQKIVQLEKEKKELADQSGDDAVIQLEKLQKQNNAFQVRIEAALANLKGETVPTA
ncbi:MAG: TIGR04211 family SH3 domain-containing protein, partial [Thioalkalispiraceae bacterium]